MKTKKVTKLKAAVKAKPGVEVELKAQKKKTTKVKATQLSKKKTVTKESSYKVLTKAAPKKVAKATKSSSLVKASAVPVLKKEKAETKIKTIFKKSLRILGRTGAIVLGIAVLFFIWINLPVKASNNTAKVGVTFSNIYAEQIGLDWREAYLAMLNDLNIKDVRLPIYWDRIEKSPGEYDFSDIDWQLEQARVHQVRIVLAMGKKVPRWPECYIPGWVGSDQQQTEDKLLAFEQVVLARYKDNHPEIVNWQIENEPFLNFGICGTVSADLLDREIAQVKKIDPSRKIIVTDSGELSLWVKAASRADIFGTTMYREVYSQKMGHWRYPIGPNFFKAKQLLIKIFAKQDNAIVVELQGEPWVAGWTTDAPVKTQLASMNANILLDNVEFAKKTGMKEIYVWGVEWWYYMKTVQHNATLWDVAKTFNR